MRTIVLAGVLVAISSGCNGGSTALPPGDGYGPLGNDQPATGATPPPTSAPTTPPAPTMTSPPPPPPPPPSGWKDAGESDAGDGSGWDAGAYDAGASVDSGAWAPDAGAPSTLLALCVGEINQVRNQNGAFPYTESTALEAYAAQNATSDARSGQLFGYFNQTGGGGVATTENEYDGAQVDPGATAQLVLSQGLLDDENGNSGGFGNLVTNQLSQVGCGFAQDGAGNWWVAIEFQ